MKKQKSINRHLSVFVTYFFLVPLVYYIPTFIDQVFKLTRLLNVLISVGIIVVFMSYFIMPSFVHYFGVNKNDKISAKT